MQWSLSPSTRQYEVRAYTTGLLMILIFLEVSVWTLFSMCKQNRNFNKRLFRYGLSMCGYGFDLNL